MKTKTLILMPVFIFALCGDALADSSLPRPFAPWMVLEDSLRDPLPRATDATKPATYKKQYAATAGTPPRAPVITPEDTKQLIEQLYESNSDILPSPLEQAYSKRIVDQLEQFGYDLFGAKTERKNKTEKSGDDNDFALPAGAVQDDFLLSIGDSLDVTFRGQRQDRKTYTITSEGLLLIDEMPPIPAAGRTMGEVRAALQAETDKLHNTNVFVALDAVKQVNVLVVGHVKQPGRQNLTVFHTVLDALMAADGIEKSGSLRQIKLVRQGRTTIVDLYALLIHASPIMDISLRDGDRIIVPPIGPTVAVAGGVKRPGIYEILPVLKGMNYKPNETSQTLTLEDVLSMAGGVLSPGQNRYMKLGLTEDGKETVDEITEPYTPAFSDGGILMVAPSDEARAGTIELTGHARRTGIHALDRAPTLSALLDSEQVFGADIYPLIGVIERWNENQLAKQLIEFPPLLVVRGKFDRRLQDGDVVHLFSRAQIMALAEKRSAEKTANVIEAGSVMDMPEPEPINDPMLASFLRERSVFVRGAVRAEGAWPVAEGASLENVIAVAGGMSLEASTGNIEVTSKLLGEDGQAHGRSGTRRIAVNYAETDPATVMIGPGDSIRVNQKFKQVADNSVLIIGEVDRPGRYDLIAGDRLSDLLERAGGLTAQAYPDGAIFSRNSERKAEEARFRAQARELEVKLAAAVQQQDEPDPNQVGAVQGLITQLKQAEAVGRITVESDPGILSVQPELDILLESGDRIYVPKRPLTVRVAGEILSPAALQFRKEKNPRDYIMEAGGFTFNADKDRAFVLYPDGSAQPLLVNNWNHTPVFIPPGSTIVVPRDPKPFDFIQTAKDVSQILSNLAITGIFIDDIKNGD